MSRVFIGLPVYNGENYLADALGSLLSQTFRDFAVLISDNASTDATGQIGSAFSERDNRVVYHRHDRNLGAAPNFNYCVSQATGAYFKWMAHDDVCRPDYLQKCVEILDSDPGIVLAHARTRRIDAQGNCGDAYTRELDFNSRDPVERFSRAMALDHACVSVFGLVRLEALRQSPAIAPFVGSDRPLLADLALRGRIEYVPDELFLWRDHSERSVKLARRERLAWFYSDATPVWSSLVARQLFANQRTALLVPKTAADKSRAFTRTIFWTLRNWRHLLSDLRRIAGAVLRRN